MINTENLCPSCMNDNGGEKICPICGFDSSNRNPDNALPISFTLADRYIIGAVKAQDGEGITYIGWDTERENAVTLKEYFPEGFAIRNADKTVSMVKGGEYTFNEGLLEFMDINRQIMGLGLPSLMPVTDIFEFGGTVYSVTNNISAISLADFLTKNGGSLKWEQARPLFLPLIDTVKGMNDLRIIHGGISTETILVGRDGKLRISDFTIRKLRMKKSEIHEKLYDSFAAAEQYSTDEEIDTYTDVYGLCAVLFNVLIGNPPAIATDRIQNGAMTIPSRFAEELPRHVLSALANGLQVLPQNRTKNIEDFKNELVYAETAESAAPPVRKPKQNTDISSKTVKKKGGTAKYAVISAACTAVVFLVIIAILIFTVFREDIFGSKEPVNSTPNSSVAAPSVDQIGDIESGAEVSDVLFEVPELVGKYYAEIYDNSDYDKFEFVIKNSKEYSDKYARGQICAQSVAAGTGVKRDTKVEITISLGAKEFKIANLLGLTEEQAKLELLKQGFLYENIEVLEKYDEDKEPKTILEQEPAYGSQVSADTPVKIYINSYLGNTESQNSSNSSSKNNTSR